MIQSLFDLVREWHGFAQLIALISISGFMTLIVLALIGFAGEFFNTALPILVRGYDPAHSKEDPDKNTEEV